MAQPPVKKVWLQRAQLAGLVAIGLLALAWLLPAITFIVGTLAAVAAITGAYAYTRYRREILRDIDAELRRLDGT